MTRAQGTGLRARKMGVYNELGGGGGFLARLQDCKTARPRAASRSFQTFNFQLLSATCYSRSR